MGDRRAGSSSGYESTDKPRLAPETMEIESGRMIQPSYWFSKALSCSFEKKSNSSSLPEGKPT